MRRRALLAIVFAGGLLNSPLFALSQPAVAPKAEAKTTPDAEPKPEPNLETRSEPNLEPKSSESLIAEIANNAQLKPEIRAYYLLQIANGYLVGKSEATIVEQFKFTVNEVNSRRLYRRAEMWESSLVSFAKVVSEYRTFKPGTTARKSNAKSDSQSISAKNAALATQAIQKALIEADQTSDQFAKLNLYFVASRLFEEIGNIDGMQKCNEIVDKTIQSCEQGSNDDPIEIKAASSILNSMAYGLIPVSIPDYKFFTYQQSSVPPFTEIDFKESEKLKLRANALVDRLDATNHVRRKAHRDLSLWYTKLGNDAMGEKEAQVLFDLIGIKDHALLYPAAQGCGRVVWWQVTDTRATRSYCGMG